MRKFLLFLAFLVLTIFTFPRNIEAQQASCINLVEDPSTCGSCTIDGACGSHYQNCGYNGTLSDGSGSCSVFQLHLCDGDPNSCQLPSSCTCGAPNHTFDSSCGGGSYCTGTYSADGCKYCQTWLRAQCNSGTCSNVGCQPGTTGCGTSLNPCANQTCSAPTPNCDTGITCGLCSAASGACGTVSGTQICTYTQSSTGQACTQAPAPNQACTVTNNCPVGTTCQNGVCNGPAGTCGSTTCGTYPDTWSCTSGATIQCTSYATSPNSCGTPCQTICGQCPNGSSGTHMACVNSSCQSVSGSGANTCSSNADCGGGPGNTCSGTFCSNGQCRQYNPGCDSVPTNNSACNGGAGCGNGSCTLGPGANGCNDGSGRCCQSGASCQGSNPGTCSNNTPSPACLDRDPNNQNASALGSPFQITPGYNQAGQASAIPNWDPNVQTDPDGLFPATEVNFTFNQNPDMTLPNGAGVCNGQGREFQISMGECPAGTIVYNPVTCTSTTYTSIQTPRFRADQCSDTPGDPYFHTGGACTALGTGGQFVGGTSNSNMWISVPSSAPNWGDWRPNPYPGGFQIGHTYWYQLSSHCDCDPSLSQYSGFWTFVYGSAPPPPPPLPQPAAPTLICQAATDGNSGDIHDICDTSRQGSPLGYGSGTRYNLNGLDRGPIGSRQVSYIHQYTISDLTPGFISTQIFNGSNNGANTNFSLSNIYNLLTPLGTPFIVNGHRYSWNVDTIDAGFPANPTPDSGPSTNGAWTFLYDTAPPSVSISSTNVCFDSANPPTTLAVSTSDPGTPTMASNIRTLTATITNEAGTPVVTNQDLMPSCSWGGFPAGQGNGSCSVNISSLPSGHNYTVMVTSTDNAGNFGAASSSITVRPVCIGPWLQGNNGDTFSNSGVTTPGGPH